jgi:hypothetical protein
LVFGIDAIHLELVGILLLASWMVLATGWRWLDGTLSVATCLIVVVPRRPLLGLGSLGGGSGRGPFEGLVNDLYKLYKVRRWMSAVSQAGWQ